MTDVPVLSLQAVTKKFGGLIAVDQLSFDVMEHEVFGLIGPNGSGKTTVLNLISGFLKLTTGIIELHRKRISGFSAAQTARIGISRTFQLIRMLPTMSVGENIAAFGVFGHRRYWGAELDYRIDQLLEKVALSGKKDQSVSELTYIDQKRVELARALIADPQLLLLDEWLSGLNSAEMQIGIELIQDIRREGRTIIFVEHYMDAVRSLCDRCVVMNSGIKIAEGTPETVLSDKEVISAYLGDDDA